MKLSSLDAGVVGLTSGCKLLQMNSSTLANMTLEHNSSPGNGIIVGQQYIAMATNIQNVDIIAAVTKTSLTFGCAVVIGRSDTYIITLVMQNMNIEVTNFPIKPL